VVLKEKEINKQMTFERKVMRNIYMAPQEQMMVTGGSKPIKKLMIY
jgi:hypothetical protein